MFNKDNAFSWPKNKSQTIRLSDGARLSLYLLEVEYGLTRTEVIERLVWFATGCSEHNLQELLSLPKADFFALLPSVSV